MINILELDRLKLRSQKFSDRANNIERILVLSDLHIPYHREELILDIIKKHKDEISMIIFGGDIIDCYAISSFSKEHNRPLVDEIVTAYNFMRKVDRIAPEIKKKMIRGNHEDRLIKYLADNPNELSVFHSNNVLDILVGGFTEHNRFTGRKKVYPPLPSTFESINSWYIQYKDLIVAHPKDFSKINLRTATNAVEYFVNKGLNFNTLLVAHTHKYGITKKFNKFTSEIGCLCHAMPYAETGKLGYTPQHYGYALIVMVDGITDINQSRVYSLDVIDEAGDDIWLEEFDLKI